MPELGNSFEQRYGLSDLFVPQSIAFPVSMVKKR